jgi:ABC-type uncharacterized transport system auxiliary subunit
MKKLTAFATVLFLAAACAGKPVPTDLFFRLPAPAAAESVAGLSSGPVFVEQFIADGVHRERPIVYAARPQATELQQYHYYFWTDSPTRLVRDHLIDFLRAGNAASLVSSSPDVAAELGIFGRIRQFEFNEEPGNGEVAVALEFRVERAGRNTPLLIKAYEERAEPRNDTMNGVVDAFGAALSRIYERLAADIRSSP